MESWRDTLIAEHTELTNRLSQLTHVLVSGGEPVSPSVRRLQLATEQKELSERLLRLNDVLATVPLPDKQLALMTVQAFVMTDYLNILEKRIALP